MAAAQEFSDDEINDEKTRFWNANVTKLTEEVNTMFAVDAFELYFNALKEYSPEEYRITLNVNKTGHLYFEDMLCIVYLNLLSGKISQQYKISQIVVDEAQDYPPIIYKILARLCKGAKFTILGDINQALNPQIGSISEIEKYIPAKNVRVFNLIKSYRSTSEINRFINQFKKEPIAAEYLDRHGKEPEIVKTDDPVGSIADKIEEFKSEGFFSNAVICRDESHAVSLFEKLSNKGVEARIIKHNSVIVPGQTYVIPVYLSKGLEFDGVIIPDKNEFSDSTEEKQLLYVSCSRALHRLTILEKDRV